MICPCLRNSLLSAVVLFASVTRAEVVPVRHPQGTTHGFLAVRSMQGTVLAVGDLVQTVQGDRVTSHLIFRFRDGSLDDETTVFSQKDVFRLISDHHVQKGRSFPKPIDVTVEASGKVTSRSTGKDGKESIKEEHLDLPPDVANGLIQTLLTNLRPDTPEVKVAMVAPTDKPRLVTLAIKPAGQQAFSIHGVRRQATDFLIHVELGGVAGAVAPLVGKQPADIHVWVLEGEAPTFVKEIGQLYQEGPIWRIELTSPDFSQSRHR